MQNQGNRIKMDPRFRGDDDYWGLVQTFPRGTSEQVFEAVIPAKAGIHLDLVLLKKKQNGFPPFDKLRTCFRGNDGYWVLHQTFPQGALTPQA